ncbi:Rne/Rng family ribonuclease, partial [Streptomyces albidoflavus]|uniref:Rne/Rng family ribonuclease n=1 Tax=Streptomyces albidoflavus TaxID=1886 RepID=UPI00340411DE
QSAPVAALAEEPAEEAAPARPRRRASRRASAPAGTPGTAEVVEQAEQTAPAESAAPAEQAAPAEESAAPAEESAAPARKRRRATRPAEAAAPAPVEEEAAEEPAAAEAESAAPAEEAAPTRTRRRATRRVSAPVSSPVAAEAEGTPEEPTVAEDSSTEASSGDTAEESGPRRARRKPVRKGGLFSEPDQPKGDREERQEKESGGRGSRRRPAVAVFQAPVFSEPMFQTPERAAAEAASSAAADTAAPEPEAEEQTPRKRRRRRGEDAPAQEAAPVQEKPAERAPEPEAAEDEAEDEHHGARDDEEHENGERPSRRRRRGGRRRRRGESGDADHEQDEQQEQGSDARTAGEDSAAEDEKDDQAEDEGRDEQRDEDADNGSGSSSSRRRRRRRRRAGDGGGEPEQAASGDDPERTVVKVREPRERKKDEPGTGPDEVQSIKGSTRLEAKKQRRREGREQGRRRVPIITEAEFLARREAVERVMVVRQSGERTQIGVLEDDVLVEHYVNKEQATSYVGNVYLGKVQNVLPSMEAAFIDIGKGRNAVLYAGEVNFAALGMAHGPRRIESALKSGQSVLVQVTKDPIGHKGARLTSQVSLPGRYLVYVPEGSMTGISRKLPDTERARLKGILKKIVPEDAGVIVRTAAEGASEEELRRDVERLHGQWQEIQKKANASNASSPSLLYGEPDMTVRVVRDIFNEDFSKVIVSGDEAWKTVHGYVSKVAPDLVDRLQRWTSETDVFATYRIDEGLAKALDRKVWLPSGGSLVIDKTEAMIVVDVNTGKFTGQGGNLEETVTRNNLEAAEEIVRQLRLRDLGGIVVIDFIDMVLESNRDLVLRRLLECLGRDRTKHQVAEVTSLGLVQMTRKRVGQGLLESFSETCVHCNGRGVIVHLDQPAAGNGGGGKRKKRSKGGQEDTVHTHDHGHDQETEPESFEVETEAEVAAETAEPTALPAPEFVPDEELYSSAAEAEAADDSRGSRHRAARSSAPARLRCPPGARGP